ncbi:MULTISPECIES: hypothetical protein [unclassified Undibacterium]|uniref:hypothetical protein n=1 Tax=unclassified Undibacterium TaxID=2630295 RepID=UPI002AC8F22E|nr:MULTISPECIES: hypothetical protein [unclassified Undibacterium]MEB0139707.1 hypothetical protein [Undibacterium sp. CCC2.1]MEB0172588.1 hypothetical protein [Undibacterium sp. CCC1.1]MEB0176431.1 hypothetical protein [Undibacterium sp. CCC3.4]MEB0215711.1 hypothetical protein [Undibacterium sp. 5I2]WPX45137.1 hypothetical protein RHM61_07915 [Undibacterium sp. CCC3.4]
MIYEILVRPADKQKMSSEHLIWIDSDLPSRSFEKWLSELGLLDHSKLSAIVRWSIVQTTRPAHFKLATQAKALKSRISELMSGVPEVRAVPDAAKALSVFRFKAPKHEFAGAYL